MRNILKNNWPELFISDNVLKEKESLRYFSRLRETEGEMCDIGLDPELGGEIAIKDIIETTGKM